MPAHGLQTGRVPADIADVSLPSWLAPQSSAIPQELNDLPGCVFADARRRSDPWRRWRSLVLDTATALRPDDVPPDLVDTARAGLNGGYLVRAIVIDDLRAMARAARTSGAGLAIQSAYRSYAEQTDTFAYWVAVAGRHQALGRSARPGHSEHQLGTTIDFMSADGGARRGTVPTGGDSAAGRWLMRHAWQYGFVLSYPRGARDVTCYGIRAVALPLPRPAHRRRDPRVRDGAAGVAAQTMNWSWRAHRSAPLIGRERAARTGGSPSSSMK